MVKRRSRARVVKKTANSLVFHKGHRLKVPNHPTEFCAEPWFPLIVRINNPATAITVGNIYTSLIAQIPGLSFVDAIFCARLYSIRVWGPIPVTNAPLRCVFRDIFDDLVVNTPAGSQATLEVVENYGDQVNRARVGYVYSSVQQQKSLFCVSGATDVIVSISGAGTGSVAYVQLLWRPSRTTAALTSENEVQPLQSLKRDIQVLSIN